MNLIADPWIPVRCRSGGHRFISPLDLADGDDPPIELAALRPDFNGALAQMLVGLLQWFAPDSEADWRGVLHGRRPFELERLRELVPHFDFDSGERRFMQDMDFAAAEAGDLSALLLEAPGANTIKNNADLFIKRRDPMALSLSLAAQVLLTLQINAPSGGQGHRTSLRGGGPVSMLLWPERLAGEPALLWQKLWLNTLAVSGAEPRPYIVFPWLGACLTSEQGQQDVRTRLEDRDPSAIELTLLCYFATPRRIRLRFDDAKECVLTGEQGRCSVGFDTRNFGANYRSDLFRHPMSPYYRASDGEFLPVHVGEIGFTYADWIATQRNSDGSRMPAVLDCSRLGDGLGRELGSDAIWAFGYTMDNMKCLAWHEARYPLQAFDDEEQRARVLLEAQRWIDGAELVRRELAKQLRAAWSVDRKGDTSIAERELYALTERTFYRLVRDCANLRGADASLDVQHQELLRRWHRGLTSAALTLFERHAERSDVAESTLHLIERAARARYALSGTLQGVLKDILQLDVAERSPKKAKRRNAA